MRSSNQARAAADQQESERRRLELIGIRESAKIIRRIRAEALMRYRRGGDPETAIITELSPLIEVVQRGMVSAHLAGVDRQVRVASAVKRKQRQPLMLAQSPYTNAIDFFVRRLEIPETTLQALMAQYRAPAFEVVANAGTTINRAIGAALADVTKRGLHERDGVAAIRKAFESAGVTTASDHLLQTTYRTQTQLAYSVGRLQANADPAIREILWGYEYVTVGDDRVRPTHAALDGFRAPKDDPAWSRIMPPNGYNCRCSVIEVWSDDPHLAKATGPLDPVTIDGATVTPDADEGWRFNPLDLAESFAGLT